MTNGQILSSTGNISYIVLLPGSRYSCCLVWIQNELEVNRSSYQEMEDKHTKTQQGYHTKGALMLSLLLLLLL